MQKEVSSQLGGENRRAQSPVLHLIYKTHVMLMPDLSFKILPTESVCLYRHKREELKKKEKDIYQSTL